MKESKVSKTFRIKESTSDLIFRSARDLGFKNQTDAVEGLIASGSFFTTLDPFVREKILKLVTKEYELGNMSDIGFTKQLITALNL
tara:strand:- start:4335 stop:4592 length:258 start_codon:yes stop_codon:yes gene_type:complete